MTKQEALAELDRIEGAYQIRKAAEEKAKPYMVQMELHEPAAVREFWLGPRAYGAVADHARLVSELTGDRPSPGDVLTFMGVPVRLGPESCGLDDVVARP